MKLYGQQIINWEGLKEIPPEQHKIKILEAVADFMKRVGKMPIDNVKMTGADVNLTSGIAPVTFRLTDTLYSPDRGYEVLFDEFDMRSSTSKSFDLLDVSGGVTFYQQIPGEEAKLSKLPSAAKAAVAMLRFTGGFPILDDWLRFNEYYKIDELTSDTVKRWYDKKATLFYGLLVALGAGINETFATDDVTTINNACVTILNDLEALGYPVTENNRFYITCNPTLKMRISKALAAAFINPNTNNNEIVWPIAGIISTTKIASTSYYVSLPGGKNKRGEWEDLNAREPQRNELKLGADHVWTGAYNGAIGEANQHRRCALS
jgi:hypothetical protein